MMRNTPRMIDAARDEGGVAYRREAQRILEVGSNHQIVKLLQRVLPINGPVERALADPLELALCRRAVIGRLRSYNRTSLSPQLGSRMTKILDSVLRSRVEMAEQALNNMRQWLGNSTTALERRLLRRFALRRGQATLEQMLSEKLISKEVTTAFAASSTMPGERASHAQGSATAILNEAY
jgi:Na+:H+ antiporter